MNLLFEAILKSGHRPSILLNLQGRLEIHSNILIQMLFSAEEIEETKTEGGWNHDSPLEVVLNLLNTILVDRASPLLAK